MMTLRELLRFNIFLQVFDGMATYFILSRGGAELNPFVGAAIDAWGLVWALVYWKVFVCALLVILYSLRRYREDVDAGGLMYYGADLAESYRRVAYYVDRILKGLSPPTCRWSSPRNSSW